ncbi:InlB B-repeat-containing protein [Streptomyces klenkii]
MFARLFYGTDANKRKKAVQFTIENHLLGRDGDSPYISTTEDLQVARRFAHLDDAHQMNYAYETRTIDGKSQKVAVARGIIYTIKPTKSNMRYAEELAKAEGNNDSVDPSQKEWVAYQKIDPENIESAELFERVAKLDTNGQPTQWSEATRSKAEVKIDSNSIPGSLKNSNFKESHPGYSIEEGKQPTPYEKLAREQGEGPRPPKRKLTDEEVAVAAKKLCVRPGLAALADNWCTDINWDEVKKKAKATVDEVRADTKHVKSLPERTAQGLDKNAVTEVATKTHSKIGKVGAGLHSAVSAAGVALWAHDMAKVWRDDNATGLDKAAVTSAVVPGLGQALGIANGIQHKDPTAVAANAISLAALVAAQAIPGVDVVVDTALVTAAIVETIIDLFKTGAGPATPADPGASARDLPTVKASVEAGYWHLYVEIRWDASVNVPPDTKVVVKERGDHTPEYTFSVSDGKSPNWLPPQGYTTRTWDVFYRLKTSDGKVRVSKKTSVVKVVSGFFRIDGSVKEEDWPRGQRSSSPERTHKVLMSVSPEKSGAIEASTYPGPDGAHAADTDIKVKAHPAEGYEFVQWVENGNPAGTEPARTISVTKDVTLRAEFRKKEGGTASGDKAKISVRPWEGPGKYSGGKVELSPEQPQDGYGKDINTVKATATPDAGYRFVRWMMDGQPYGGTGPKEFWKPESYGCQAVFRIPGSKEGTPAPKELLATFEKVAPGQKVPDLPNCPTAGTAESARFKVAVTPSPTDGGKIDVVPKSTDSMYAKGTELGLAAFPAKGYELDHWIVDGKKINTKSLSLTQGMTPPVTHDMNVTAVFVKSPTSQ